MAIRNPEHFGRAWMDYSAINAVLPSGMRFSDIDAILESNGYFLILEMKMFKEGYTPEGTLRRTIKPGQDNLQKKISRLRSPGCSHAAVTVLRVAGEYNEEHKLIPAWIQMIDEGREVLSVPCDLRVLQRLIARWQRETERRARRPVAA